MESTNFNTGLRTETFENLVLNAGMFVKDLDYSSISDASALKTALIAKKAAGTDILGATRGGGSFVATREIRTPDVDGRRYAYKGDKIVDSIDARLSTTLLELTPGRLKDAFGSAEITTNGKKKTIRVKTAIAENDYLGNLCWVGSISDGRLAVICLYNALNTADLNITFADKNEATLPVEFHAHQGNVDDYEYAPFEIVYFEPDGTAETITVTSAEGTNVGATKLTTTNVLASGQKYVYKVGNASTAPAIDYREEPDYSWTEWDGTSDIAVGADADGKKATVAVINSSNVVIKTGTVTLDVKTA